MINPDGNPVEPERRPPFPGSKQPYKFSADELRVLRECNRESFYQRCLPLAALLGGSTYYGVQSGFLKPNPRFGPTPKVMVAVAVGYFLGKFSYQNKCAEKIMALPNSRLADMLRQRRRGTIQESMDSGYGPSMSLGSLTSFGSSDSFYSDIGPPNSLDMDTNRPLNEGLDDAFRPSVDNPIIVQEEEMPPEQPRVTTYDELRRKNREEYQQKRTSTYREPVRTIQPPLLTQQQPEGLSNETNATPTQKTKYGDVWG